VHVTSFLDPRTPQRLRAALEAVRQRSPATVISFDPGHVWATNPTPDIAGIVRLADFLLLNQREFQSLGGHRAGDDETGVAARLLGQARAGATILVKKPSGSTTFTRDDGRVHYAHSALTPDEVADATGAGDVFAAGLLAVIASDRRQVELGSRLGMALARHKLRHVGQSGHAQFPRITEDLIRSPLTWR